MDTTTFETYLKNVQIIAKKIKEDRSEIKTLFQCIDESKQWTTDNPDFENFFKGEFYFYRGNYEQALKYYLESKSTPFFPFFCYRASGYISLIRKDKEKALHFAEKAKEIFPEDPTIQDLIDKAMENDITPPLFFETEHPEETEAHFSDEIENTPSLIDETFKEKEENQELDQKTFPLFPKIKEVSQNELELQAHFFDQAQKSAIENYLEKKATPFEHLEHCFFFLQNTAVRYEATDPILDQIAPRGHQIKGGIFFRWNQKGVAINPGKGFLKGLHEMGLHIHHLDAIIITKHDPEAYADIEDIYALNRKLNEASKEPHVIHYYLNPKAHQDLSPILKPHFKQERRSLHPLELFIDSPDVEKIEISKGIVLHYFPLSHQLSSDFKEGRNFTSLGIRLDLSCETTRQTICKLGYIAGASWSPIIPHHLGNCDLLIAGYGISQPKKQDKDPSLGYYGTFSLLEEISPKILILAEINGKEGDIRLEATKKIRQDYIHASHSKKIPPVVIPGDFGLQIDLKTLNIACSISKKWLLPSDVHVIKTQKAFQLLQYASSEYLI